MTVRTLIGVKYWLGLVCLAGLYYAAGRLGLMIDAVSGFATLVWAPTGISLAAILLFGPRMWPAIAAAALAANLAAGAPVLVAIGISVGNTLEALVGAYLLKSRGFRLDLRRVQDVTVLVIFGALLSTLISATIGTASLWLGHVIALESIRSTWGAWWVGDVLGNLIVAPLLLVWSDLKSVSIRRGARRFVEVAGLVSYLALVGYLVFDQSIDSALAAIPLPYFVFPVSIWVALRFGVRATVTWLFIFAVAAVWATALDMGPYVREALSMELERLHFFLGTVAVTSLMLAAAAAERVPIDQLTKASEERDRVEQLFRAILHSAYDAFVAIDSSGHVIEWNAQAERTFGWTRAEAIGQLLGNLLVPARMRAQHRDGIRRFSATGEGPIINRRIELPALHKAGHELPVELTVTPVKVGNSLIFGAFLHDISDKKRHELLQSMQLAVTRVMIGTPDVSDTAAEILEVIGTGLKWEFGAVWTRDSAGTCVKCLRTWCASKEKNPFAAGSAKQVFRLGEGLPGRVWQSGKPAWIVDVTRDLNFPRADLAVELDLHGAFAFPITIGDDVVGVMEFISKRIEQPDDELLEAMADIGTRFGAYIRRYEAEKAVKKLSETLEQRVERRTATLKRVSEDLREAKEAAEAANAAKSAFLANMSHEIRTPLGAVLGFSELLASQRLPPSEQVSYLETIKRNGELLSNIINDILDLSKVEAGKLQVERQFVSLPEVLTDLTTILNLQAQEKGLTLAVLSVGAIPTHIETDPLRLRQILLNVVGNAIKFTERGTIEVRVKLEQAADQSLRLAFYVKDTGPGMAPEHAANLFVPFNQADVTTKRKFGGTGLGLVLSKRLANLLGGDVALVESQVGKGSTFMAAIDPGPVASYVSESAGIPVKAAQPMYSGKISLEGVRILLAEDAPDNQVLIGRMLKMAGAEVVTAANGEEALAMAMAEAEPFDVVLMDLQMPRMDGYEATRALRGKGYVVPIIALTAHALKEERQRCLRSGFSDHLSKPIDRLALLDSIALHAGRLPSGPEH